MDVLHAFSMSFILFFFNQLQGFMNTPLGLLNHLTIFLGLLVDFFKASSHEGHA
jgi:hypothetical protein